MCLKHPRLPMCTRVGKKYGEVAPAKTPHKKMFGKRKKRKKHRDLRMCTRTGPYVVTYMMLIIMLTYVTDII